VLPKLAEPCRGEGQRRITGMFPTVKVAHQRLVQPIALKPVAIGCNPSAERGHHLADMLADHEVTHAFLPQLAVHIIDEQLGQHNGAAFAHISALVESQYGKCGQGGDHFKAVINGIGELSLQIPDRIPGFGHDRIVEGAERMTPFIPRKNLLQKVECHAANVLTGLLFLCPRHIGGSGPFSKGSDGVMERPPCMNRKLATAVALTVVLLSTSACTRIRGHQGFVSDVTLVDSIQAGVDNRDSVEKTLGRPTWVSEYGPKDYYYFARDTRQYAFNLPKASQQLVLRIRFDDAGNVVAVDRRGGEQIASIRPTGEKTPTLGRERSFFEELFGNIGSVGAVGESAGTADNPN
jgi:outer membrane protein assembly factor BamE (lipoprotein component of BamABCDE complex)